MGKSTDGWELTVGPVPSDVAQLLAEEYRLTLSAARSDGTHRAPDLYMLAAAITATAHAAKIAISLLRLLKKAVVVEINQDHTLRVRSDDDLPIGSIWILGVDGKVELHDLNEGFGRATTTVAKAISTARKSE